MIIEVSIKINGLHHIASINSKYIVSVYDVSIKIENGFTGQVAIEMVNGAIYATDEPKDSVVEKWKVGLSACQIHFV